MTLDRFPARPAFGFILLFSLVGCAPQAPPPPAPRPLPLVAPEALPDSEPRHLSGEVVPISRATLSFKLAGVIRHYPAQEGQAVRQGEVLAVLDPLDYQLKWKADQARFEQANRELGRLERLLRSESITVSERDRMKAVRDMALAQRDKSAHDLEETRLKAPFDGIVQKRFSRPHETVGAGTPVLELVDPTRLELEVPLSDSLYRQRTRIRELRIPISGQDLSVPVRSIAPMGNISHLHLLRSEPLPAQAPFSPGQTVAVHLMMTRPDGPTHALPLSALVHREGQQGIWVWTPVHRQVHFLELEQTTLLDANRFAFRPPHPLPASAQVVTRGQGNLKADQRVEPLQKQYPSHPEYLP